MKIMGTKEEIEKFLKNCGIWEKFSNKKSSYYTIPPANIIDLIQRALDHFKPKLVTSKKKLKELFELTFGKEARNDKDLMYLYSECLKYAVEEITNQKVVSDVNINEVAICDCYMKDKSKIVNGYYCKEHKIFFALGNLIIMKSLSQTVVSDSEIENKQINNNKALRIGGVMLRDYLLTCRVEENGTGSGEFNHITNIFEVIRDLKRSKSWYFKAAKNLEECDSKFWRACGTDICFYLKLSTTVTEPKDNWVNVKDGLPKVDVNVLIYRPRFNSNKLSIAHISGANSWYDYERPIEYIPTHWQPLPKNPN